MSFDAQIDENLANNPLSIRLLSTQLSLGLACCRVARVRLELNSNYDVRKRKAAAQQAFDNASDLANRIGLNYSDVGEMTARLERLGFEIRSFDMPNSGSNEVSAS
jgi:hypothetical protein